VCLSGAPDKHTDGTDIRPQTARIYNECKSTDPSLVTWLYVGSVSVFVRCT